MPLVDRNSFLWSYLQPELKDLISDGEILVDFVKSKNVSERLNDCSFLVFPFSKAYEGFLKKLFLDLGVIHYDDYYGDDIRIGRLLNPHYQHEIDNVFAKMCRHSGKRKDLSERLWNTWKRGRNLVFHYFPHNFKRLSYDEALEIVSEILASMEVAVAACDLAK